jgi:iron-sulfur cluster repair protein YtfE (RIC family)
MKHGDRFQYMSLVFQLFGTIQQEMGAHMQKDLHKHVHLENNVLFPKIVALMQD